jgi:hypothetical protein
LQNGHGAGNPRAPAPCHGASEITTMDMRLLRLHIEEP